MRARERDALPLSSLTRCHRSSGQRTANGVVTYRNRRWFELTGLERGRAVAWQDSSTRTMRSRPAKPGTRRRTSNAAGRRVSDPPRRRHVPLVPGPRAADPRRDWVGTSTDIEDRKLAEERQASSPRPVAVLGELARLRADAGRRRAACGAAVADWCAVDISSTDGSSELALEHADPLKLALARELEERNPLGGRGSRRAGRERVLVTEIRRAARIASASTTTSSRSRDARAEVLM